MTTPSELTPESQPRSRAPRLFVIGGLVLLSVGVLLACTGMLAAPFVLLTFRREAQRVENQRAVEQARAIGLEQQAAHQKEKPSAESAADAPDSEPDRARSE